MKIFTIKNIGKLFFWLSFILGSICLFGYVFTKDIQFAIAGYFLLIYGGIINLMVFVVLIIAAFFNIEKKEDYVKSAYILLINIPIAILYAWIGLSII
ncbi:hypothetical protein GCM10010992_22540 [Cloacibacterium rupense]|uniref:Branched-chain amino acid:cation transporter, LIVCS family n=1 Tax=Cloacibacterium rupense TaxID=517423 RepID=A0ABQ2NS18_9FLAO|nr:hypothetical protein [Cloacibacterium rupense]GGP05642.1 hypothetical protein GCM10010992_22540 [Cloacibacterium rupense]